MSQDKKTFKPFVSPETNMKELTVKSILVGSLFGVIFGAATVYLALKAGLTVSASIPIAVIAITLGRKFLKTTILENNIIQTTGSAGESIAAGVAFTLPGFLFLSSPDSAAYFNYMTILVLAIVGGLLGTLLMVPLRKALIVNEHDNLPYPEGTACGDVLIAGEKGGDFAKTAFWGLGVAFVYAILQKVLHVIAETPYYATKQVNKFFPSAKVSGEITPEYMGVGYIIGPKIAGVLVAGSVLSWMVFIPLLSTLVPPDMIAVQLNKLGYLADVTKPGGKGGWDPVTHTFADYSAAIYYAYVRLVGAGAVTAGGVIALVKTIPVIVKSVRESFTSLKSNAGAGAPKAVARTDKDLSLKVVGIGSLALVVLIAVLPQVPGDNIGQKLLIGVLVLLFGALFVTVSSRIVGLIGSSNNPISGMTIATVMGTSLIFLSVGWSGIKFEPLVLVVGGMICIAAANAGATSQDLKSGYIVGATPRNQQIALFVGAIVSSIVIGLTVKFLDKPTAEMAAQGITHALGTDKYPAPQATLLATLDKGILSRGLDWQYIVVGIFLAITMELCGIKSLSFAIGVYLPLATTLPIFAGGAIRGIIENKQKKANIKINPEEEELGKGNLFATGLVAGGAVAGVAIAFLSGTDVGMRFLNKVSLEAGLVGAISHDGYFILGTLFFIAMGIILYRVANKKSTTA
jgi:OPT family oligopeptide transporter